MPALNKMKQALNGYSVSFARMASDAYIEGWDPALDAEVAALAAAVRATSDAEAELDAMARGFEGDDEAAQIEELRAEVRPRVAPVAAPLAAPLGTPVTPTTATPLP